MSGGDTAGHDYRQGYRDALGMIVRGILRAEAEQVALGDLIAELSTYEEAVDAWLAAGAGEPPIWQPTLAEADGAES